MNTMLKTAAFEALRYATLAWNATYDLWTSFWDWYHWVPEVRPTRQYFYSEQEVEDGLDIVPEGAIYIEEWIANGTKKCVVRYPGEPIPSEWPVSPLQMTAKCPWIWVGDRNTEIDLTQTFAKFLVPGNWIRLSLVEELIRVTDQTRLVYIEYGSFEEKEFPGEGLLIKANGPL
jgi:hypothetical protein